MASDTQNARGASRRLLVAVVIVLAVVAAVVVVGLGAWVSLET